ncbi:MAG: hypothetical protein R3C45_22695, partial [Phycisphaerales bacterium]
MRFSSRICRIIGVIPRLIRPVLRDGYAAHLGLGCLVSLCVFTGFASAAITTSGFINPSYQGSDPWVIAGDLNVPLFSTGMLQINNGSVVTNNTGSIGVTPGTNGTVTITGAGSVWNNNSDLRVGVYGSATLNIEADGVVNVGRDTWVRQEASPNSIINLNGGTLNTVGLFTSQDDLIGTGTINTATIVSDINLVFDQVHGLQQQIILNALPGQNITINLDATVGTSNRTLGAGYSGVGSLTIADGLAVTSSEGVLGYQAGSQGTATITGAGSRWDINENLLVGLKGTGELNISNGGVVSVAKDTILAQSADASGLINLNGGTLDTSGIWAASESLSGTGTINARGIVSDIDLIFDVTHDLQQQVVLDGEPGQNITLNLDLSTTASSGALGAGLSGLGTLSIMDGKSVGSTRGVLGYRSGSNGTATVTGAGSQWNNSGTLTIGEGGTGTLVIAGGGSVENAAGYIGDLSGSDGTATVSGQDSQWINNGNLYVGFNGDGELSILGGGFVHSNQGHLGYNTNTTGIATVSGADS